jgi:two-component system, NarL family, invasion response regulator UvrY
MTRIFIVDDHAIVREGVRRIITATDDLEVTGEAASGEEALSALPRSDCDVVLLDLALPGKDGIEVLRLLKAQKPALSVLILSIYPEEDYALMAYKEGAAGYLTKDSLPGELTDAIRKVADGKKYLSDSFSKRLLDEMTGVAVRSPHETLSKREYQVFSMIVAGKSLKEMAGALSLAPTTVSTYRNRILTKMNAENSTDLVRYAIDHHLIS